MPSNNFTFLNPAEQPLSPVAQRRRLLSGMSAQRSAEMAYGRQEQAAMLKLLNDEKEEWAIRQQIVTTREVAEATQKLSNLDPMDKNWRQDYIRVMAAYPAAQKDQFLNDNFRQLGAMHQAAMNHAFADYLEGQHDTHEKERLGIEQKNRIDLNDQEFHEHAAEQGVNVEAHKQEDGTYDWSGMAQDFKKTKEDAQNLKEVRGAKVPVGIMETYGKALATLALPDKDPSDPNKDYTADKKEAQTYKDYFGALYPQLDPNYKPPAGSPSGEQPKQIIEDGQVKILGADGKYNVAPAVVTPPAQSAATPAPVDIHQQSRAWATAHPDDPRSAIILKIPVPKSGQ